MSTVHACTVRTLARVTGAAPRQPPRGAARRRVAWLHRDAFRPAMHQLMGAGALAGICPLLSRAHCPLLRAADRLACIDLMRTCNPMGPPVWARGGRGRPSSWSLGLFPGLPGSGVPTHLPVSSLTAAHHRETPCRLIIPAIMRSTLVLVALLGALALAAGQSDLLCRALNPGCE